MHKKRILFCVDFLNMTGATASLVALLQKLDYSKYDVSLFCFTHGVAYVDQVPPEVHQLPFVPDYVMYAESLSSAVKLGLKKGWFGLLARRLFLSVGSKVMRRLDKLALARKGPSLSGEYDIAIAFCCSYMWEFIGTKVTARKRVAWLDTDHRKVAQQWRMFAHTELWDKIVCVCQGEVSSLICDYPELAKKTTVVHNVIDRDKLLRCAGAYEVKPTQSRLSLVTVGRITDQKGQDVIIGIARELKRLGVSFAWRLIGPGEDVWHRYLRAAGCPDGLDGVEYCGPMVNPYPYMKSCDLYVQPSRWEGWGMTVTEAIGCGAAVLVSDLPAFREQVVDGENGWIVPLEVTAFVNKIVEVAAGKIELAKRGAWLSDYSSATDFDNMVHSMGVDG